MKGGGRGTDFCVGNTGKHPGKIRQNQNLKSAQVIKL